MKLAKRGGRLAPEAIDERVARAAKCRERVGLASCAVEGEHELAVQALAQWVLADEALDLAGDFDALAAVPTACRSVVKVFSKWPLPRWGMPSTVTRRAVVAPGRYVPWGLLAAVDLHGCRRELLEDPDRIRAFVTALVDAVEMRAHGPVLLERFGDGDLEGWSAMQFIETSSITVHADEFGGRCFVDVFSCRPFDAECAAAVAVAHFGGTPTLRVLRR